MENKGSIELLKSAQTLCELVAVQNEDAVSLSQLSEVCYNPFLFLVCYRAGLNADVLEAECGLKSQKLDLLALKQEYEQNTYYYVFGEVVEKYAKKVAEDLFGKCENAKLLQYMMRECLRNSPEHGRVTDVWTCLRFSPQTNTVEFAALDEGMGIFESLCGNPIHRKYVLRGEECLKWAIKPGVSAAFHPGFGQRDPDVWANSGFGLFMVSQICSILKGEFYLSDGQDFLIKTGEEKAFGKLPLSKGSAVGFKICLPGTSAQALIDQARKEGEKQAKEIKTAFKQASLPSKQLMD